MIFAVICLTWIGIQLNAPVWFYVLLVAWLMVRTAEGFANKKR